MEPFEIFSLQQIAGCDFNGEKPSTLFKLPDVQRGLVWNAKQIELLWDSIICGYPIGSLMIVEISPERKELYDGQQRVNAIVRGFDYDALIKDDSNPNSILWLDLKFKANKSRQFGFRITTSAHPWGYRDDGESLSVAEKRRATPTEYRPESDVYISKSQWDIRKFRPSSSELPIPFAVLTKALFETQNVDAFIDQFNVLLQALQCIQYSQEERDEIENCLREKYTDLLPLKSYKVIANKLYNTKDERSLEIFFNRINTGGTRINEEELAYSAIKLYWREGIKDANMSLAKGRMGEAKFAQMVLRYYCSEKGEIRGAINAEYIRKISEEKKSAIQKAYDNGEIQKIVNKIDYWLINIFGLPQYIRTEIVHKMPELYILLMAIADKDLQIDDTYMAAMAIYLYCCSDDSKNRAIKLLFSRITINNAILSQEDITDYLRECISAGWLLPICPNIQDFEGLKDENIIKKDWSIWNYQYLPYGKLICRLFENGNYQSFTMLKVAEKDAFKTFFADYDPARQDLWEKSNRPWDYDHIVPKNWVDKKRGQYQSLCKKWVWSIGNFAHIPFEVNRSKSNKEEWWFYINHKEIYSFDTETANLKNGLINQTQQREDFIKLTRNRFVRIYTIFASTLKVLGLSEKLTTIQQWRKNFLIKEREKLEKESGREYKLYYVLSNSREAEFEESDMYGWMQPWVSLGSIQKDDDLHMDSVTIGFERDTINNDEKYINIERGVRKSPNITIKDSIEKSWWRECCYEEKSPKEVLA